MCRNGFSCTPVMRWTPGVFELKLTRHYQVINKVSNFWSGHKNYGVGKIADFGHKEGNSFGK